MGRRPQRFWWFACAIAASIALGLAPAQADADSEAQLASLTNSTRGEVGLEALVRMPDLDEIAQRHSVRMAERGGEPWHNPELAAEAQHWSELGEIVGAVDSNSGWQQRVHDAFIQSSRHRDEIVHAKYKEAGVGVAYNGTEKRYYVTEIFRLPERAQRAAAQPAFRPAASAVAAPAPAPAPADPPKPAATADVSPAPAPVAAPMPVVSASPIVAAPAVTPSAAVPVPHSASPAPQPSAPDPLTTELASAHALAAPATGPSPAFLGFIPIAVAALPATRRLRARRQVTPPAAAPEPTPVVCTTMPAPVEQPPRPVQACERVVPLVTKPFVLDVDGRSEWERLRSQLHHAWAVIDDIAIAQREPTGPAGVDETSPFVHGRDRSSP